MNKKREDRGKYKYIMFIVGRCYGVDGQIKEEADSL